MKPKLESALARLEHPEVIQQMNACRALGERGDLRAVEPLLAKLVEGEDNAVRILAAAALGCIGDPRALAALELTPATDNTHEMYGDISSSFAKAASRLREGLGSADRRADIRRLVRGLAHPDGDVSARCAQGIVDWGEDALDKLATVKRSESRQARLHAFSAIGRIAGRSENPRGAVKLLLEGITDPDPALRRAAALGLRYRKEQRVARRLAPLLRDPDPAVRLQALLTLETIDAFETMDEIARMAIEDHAVLGPQTRLDDSAASVLRTMQRKLAAR
jgi:hypothetical protein